MSLFGNFISLSQMTIGNLYDREMFFIPSASAQHELKSKRRDTMLYTKISSEAEV